MWKNFIKMNLYVLMQKDRKIGSKKALKKIQKEIKNKKHLNY